jgi:photosystem II stability/assembly factor-like uncharacterized protein
MADSARPPRSARHPRRRVMLVLGALAMGDASLWHLARAQSAAPSAGKVSLDGNARPSKMAATSLLLAGARAGNRLVVVGEYGHILLSDDEGASWRQSKVVPTRTTLTAVAFLNEGIGWAVGHGGMVLGTRDGGENWQVLSGRIDGKDALLSVSFRDEKNGLVVGSFGYAARSSDGGATWTPFEIAPGELGERHLNQIVTRGKLMLIAAESGVAFRSDDAGATFSAVTLPYKGSIWGGTALTDGTMMLWGMRGTILRSSDEGRTWSLVPTGTDQSLAGGAQLADGTIVIAGLNGVTLVSRNGGASFEVSVRPDRGNSAAVLATKRGYLMVGPAGIRSP